MPIEQITAAQFAAQITAGINSRSASLDTTYGPIPDACIFPQASVLEAENERVRLLASWLTLSDPSAFDGFEGDLDGIVFNEAMVRSTGAGSTGVVVFSVSAAPVVDAVIPQGYPLGTTLDANSGTSIVFVTSETSTLPASSALSYFNLSSQKYELSVPVFSLTVGTVANVGPNTITRFLRPMAAFETVTNPVATAGGLDTESNAALINRYLLGVVGRQLGTPAGVVRTVLADFSSVLGVGMVYGTDPLLVRAASDAGAVDAWILGSQVAQVTENHAFPGVGQTIALNLMPLVSVVSVSSGATTFVEGTDYDVVFDDSGVSRSVRETSGVAFLAGASGLPAIGGLVTVTYTFDNLIVALQAALGGGTSGPVPSGDPETEELGRDLLFRRGIGVAIVHTANIAIRSGFSASSVVAAVRTAVLALVNGLGLGVPVREADIIATAKGVSGVLNYVVNRLSLTSVAAGVADIPIGNNAFATLASGDYTLVTVAA